MAKGSTETYRRRLVAILFADVVEYTRLMNADEVVTYEALLGILKQLETTCPDFDGQVVEVRGDGVLAIFESTTSAVRFAVEMQGRIERETAALPEDRRIRFRVGIHLGEILADDRGIHGDSVNVAARLQDIADPGRVVISASVHEQVRNKLRLGYEFLGPKTLKHVPDPVPVYRIRTDVEGVTMTASLRPGTLERGRARPEMPSVVVLPFKAYGEDPSDLWFAEGITDDITLNLSKFKNLFVIARNSAFLFRSETVTPREAARVLGVKYVACGNVRRIGGRIRIGVELIDADTERTIWGERYDRDLGDIFAIQDEVTATIVAALAVLIEAQERERMRQVPPSSLAAYGYVLQGQNHMVRYTREDNHEAQTLYEKALTTDGKYARASAALSRTLNIDWRYSWSNEVDDLLDRALDFAHNAIELDPTDARGFGELGFVHLYRKEHNLAINAYKRALTLNPNDADLISDFADALAHTGLNEEAVRMIERAMRLNPFYPDEYLWHLGGAYYNMRQYENVIAAILKMSNPTEGQRLLAASYAQLGKVDLARAIAEKHKVAHPNFSLKHWSRVVPDRLEEDAEHYVEGLRKAGF